MPKKKSSIPALETRATVAISKIDALLGHDADYFKGEKTMSVDALAINIVGGVAVAIIIFTSILISSVHNTERLMDIVDKCVPAHATKIGAKDGPQNA